MGTAREFVTGSGVCPACNDIVSKPVKVSVTSKTPWVQLVPDAAEENAEDRRHMDERTAGAGERGGYAARVEPASRACHVARFRWRSRPEPAAPGRARSRDRSDTKTSRDGAPRAARWACQVA